MAENRTTINVEIAEAQMCIDLKNAVERLVKHPDFIKVFTDNYFRDYAIGQVLARSSLAMRANPQFAESNVRKLDAIAETKSWLDQTIALGYQMEDAMEDRKAYADELRAEE